MKYALAIATIVAAVTAQGLQSLPQCGQLCVNNMIQIANSQFGCANGDAACYCRNENFGLGLRDCSGQACGADVQSQVVAYGNAYCSSAAGAAGPSGSAATTVSSVASSAASVSSSAASSASSVASSAASAASSVISSAGSAASSRAASATSSAASAAASGNYAPVMTAAPLAGALAAAAMLVL